MGLRARALFCNDLYIQGQVQNYYNAGIRVVYPVHLMDNRFGGTAVYNGLFELANNIETGSYFDIVACGSPIEWRSDIREIDFGPEGCGRCLDRRRDLDPRSRSPCPRRAMQGFMAPSR